MNEPTTYIETHNKAQLMNAIVAMPYLPGETAVIVAKRQDGGETKFTFRVRKVRHIKPSAVLHHNTIATAEDYDLLPECEEVFNKRLHQVRANVRRTPAHVWQ